MTLSYNANLMIEKLRECVDLYPLLPGLVYRSFFDFVIRHGREYPVVPYTSKRTGAPKQCFGNAITYAGFFGFAYVEGFAMTDKGGIILHAWNVDADGRLFDSTWLNRGLAYVGVEFSAERADDAIWNGDACVLNDEHRNYPVYQREWKGEDFTLKWPQSDRLDELRAGLKQMPRSMVEYTKIKGL